MSTARMAGLRIALIALFMGSAAHAQDAPAPQPVPKTEPQTEAPAEPAPDPAPAERNFKPSQDVSPDQEVDFPADI